MASIRPPFRPLFLPQDMRKQRQRIDEQQIMHYFVQILQALQYIHQERILHRDLKTSNLFLMKSKFALRSVYNYVHKHIVDDMK